MQPATCYFAPLKAMVHHYEIDGLPVQTGDILCTTDGTDRFLAGRFWQLFGLFVPGQRVLDLIELIVNWFYTRKYGAMARRFGRGTAEDDGRRGLIILQIDGLSHATLQQAIGRGLCRISNGCWTGRVIHSSSGGADCLAAPLPSKAV